MLQQEQPEDFVIATGITTRIRDFIIMAFEEVGVELRFEGSGDQEIGIVKNCKGDYNIPTGTPIVKVDPQYYRPTEVDLLIGDATKAREKLGWKPKYSLSDMVKEMVASDLQLFKKQQFLKLNGFDVRNEFE
jgi:GDPmannose 4,6-dehydratase